MSLAIPTDDDVLLQMLQRRHPEYWSNIDHWEFCELTYEGGRQWFKEHVFRYVKEGIEEFNDRRERAYRFNHTREVVDLIGKYIFKSDIARNIGDASNQVQAFWKTATLTGLSIDALMRVVSTWTSVFGRVWLWTDTTKTAAMQTRADEKAGKARVYAYFIKPQDILDYRWDDDGSLDWVIVREHYRDDKNPLTASGVMHTRYRLWTKTDWYLFEIQEIDAPSPPPPSPYQGANDIITQLGGEPLRYLQPPMLAAPSQIRVVLTGQGVNKLGVIPGRPADHVVGEGRYKAPGLIDDIVYLDKAVANYLSNLDAIIQDQTFSQLAMPAQGMIDGDDPYEKLRDMGTKRIFTYDGEGGARPEFISPDVKQADLIMEVINKIINEIYSTVGAAGERTKQDNSVGIDNSSGVAKAYDFDRLNSLLTTKSESLCDIENWLVAMVDLWSGVEADHDPLVAYPDTFDVRSLYDEFTVAERLVLMEAPDGVRQEQMKQVIDKLFPALKKDLKTALLNELKSWPQQDITAQITGQTNGDPTSKFPGNIKVMLGPQGGPAGGSRQGQVTKTTP